MCNYERFPNFINYIILVRWRAVTKMTLRICFWCNISKEDYYSTVITVQAYSIFYNDLRTLYSAS